MPQNRSRPPGTAPLARLRLALHAVWVVIALHSGVASATDVNLATEADLDSLKGVGPATTQRLLAERAKSPFASWADLMGRVKGVRAPTARKWSDQGLTVNGQAFSAPAPTATSTAATPPLEAPGPTPPTGGN